jgi:hypothetical protein
VCVSRSAEPLPVIAAAATSHGALEGSLSFDARAGAMSGGATSGMSREERKLVAAVEHFQKLEEDSSGDVRRKSPAAQSSAIAQTRPIVLSATV